MLRYITLRYWTRCRFCSSLRTKCAELCRAFGASVQVTVLEKYFQAYSTDLPLDLEQANLDFFVVSLNKTKFISLYLGGRLI